VNDKKKNLLFVDDMPTVGKKEDINNYVIDLEEA